MDGKGAKDEKDGKNEANVESEKDRDNVKDAKNVKDVTKQSRAGDAKSEKHKMNAKSTQMM